MAFKLFMEFDTSAVDSGVAKVEQGMGKAAAAATAATAANNRLAISGGNAGNAIAAAAAKATTANGQIAASGTAAGSAVAAGSQKAAAGHAQAASAAQGHGDALGNLIHLAEAYIAVHQLEAVVDGYIEVRNKINSVSDSSANMNGIMNETFRIAQETRSSWEELASTYQRISNASRGLGLSQKAVLDLVEELSMGMRLSGSSSREAAMTMGELTHAFSTGTLTGREFKVMMKDAPALMHELQVVSGHTGAEFAEMGKHGKLTAEMLVDLFGKAAPAIKEKFGETLPTISEGFQLIKNSAEKFFGSAAVGTGVMGVLSGALKFIADHFDAIGRAVLGAAEALGSLYAISKVIALFDKLTIAISANPLGVFMAAIVVGVALLRQFGDQLETHQKVWQNVEGVYVTVGDQLWALWQVLKQLGGAVVEFVEGAWNQLTTAFDKGIDGGGIELSMRSVLTFIASWVDAAIGMFRFVGDTVVTVFGGIPAIIGEAFVNLAKAAVHDVESMVNKIIDGVNKLIEAKNYLKSLMPGSEGVGSSPDAAKRAAEKWASDQNAKYHLAGAGVAIGMSGAEADRLNAQRVAGLAAAKAAGLPTPAGYGGFTAAQAPNGGGRDVANNLIKPVDLNFGNPFEGASVAIVDKFKADLKKAKETSITKNFVNDLMDRVDVLARAHAAERIHGKTADGTVNTVGGTPEKKLVDEKAAAKAEKALQKLENELRSVTEASNPQAEAIEKLSHAHEIFEKAVHAGLITQEEAERRMDNYRAKLEDQLHPFDAWIRKQHEATAALRSTAEEQDRAAKLTAFAADLKQKQGGVAATPVELAIAEKEISLGQKRAQQMQAEQGFTAAILGPQKTYVTQMEALGDLLHDGTINAEQYGIAMDGVRAAFIAAGPEGKTFFGGMEAGWLKAKADADAFGATLATTVIGELDKLNEGFLALIDGAKFSWSGLASSILDDLAKIAIKMLEVKAIGFVVGLAGGSSNDDSSGAGIAGVASGLAGTLFESGAASPAIASAAPSSQLPSAYQRPAAGSAATGAAQGPVIVQVHNHYDKDVGLAALDSRQGQKSMINTLRSNRNALRTLGG